MRVTCPSTSRYLWAETFARRCPTCIRDYVAALKEELAKLLNDDYEAFISLSTDLRDGIKEKLDRRAAIGEEKAFRHLLLKVSESITRLESLLLISSPEDKGRDSAIIGSICQPPIRLEGTDIDESQWDGKVSKVTEIEKTKLYADITECLRTYDVLGLWRDAEDVLRREVVHEFVKKSIYPGALTLPSYPMPQFPLAQVRLHPLPR
ncbi:hypothetical protein OH76DRAFT_1487966 [Lentinus brumalis]|uniref:Conserved oligomeric Golgi complex subunit 2 n=1 Tax=Lentinus brumalis TaxID=2498619 RepID=A0A371CSK6_9APHY|nr:hypothetical protein OH76DRAFT_1487966 [Polyporus brumalis]